MPLLTSPNEILRRDTAQAQRLVQGVGQQRTMGLLQKAQSELDARLKRAEGLGGPGRDSFTAAQLRTTLAQVRAVTAHLQVGMKGVVQSQAKSAAEWAANSAVSYLNRAERHFTGSTERLNLNGARIVDRAVANTNSSVLNRLLNGPDPRKKAGILQRYGENVVENFEARLQQRLIQRKPLAEVRDELIEDSPFLQGAPGHWAERIVRTETMHAENTAILETIHQADDELGDMCKIISSVFDARTGADSFAVHGQIRRPKEAFDSWFGSYQNPPDRPNDRSIAVPHRISWPIPDALKPKSDGAVSARWSAEGRKGSPPARPKMSTIPLEQFGKPQPLPPGALPPAAATPEPKRLAPPVDRRVAAQVPGSLRGRWPEELPDEPTPFSPVATKIADAKGSNPGGIYEGTDGVQRYVKFYPDPAQAVAEHLANSVYRELGLGGVDSQTFEHEGKLAYASAIVPNTRTLADVLKTSTPAQAKKLALRALNGFAGDVLTANWDAAGLSLDNMLVDAKGNILRIDNGGSFLHRAQGARKPLHLLNDPTEWESLFNPGKNPGYARLAKIAGVSGPADLAASIKKQVKTITGLADAPGGWSKFVSDRAPGLDPRDKQQMIDMLNARTAFLKKQVALLPKPAKKPKAGAPVPVGAHAPITSADIAKSRSHYMTRVAPAAVYLRKHEHLSDLRDYTDSSYSEINSALVGKQPLSPEYSKGLLSKAARITKVLADAKAAGHAIEGPMLRGIRVDNDTLQRILGQDELKFDAFTSVTVSEDVAKSFSRPRPDRPNSILFRMHQRSAVPIDKVSMNQGEAEALLPPGTRFKVIARSVEDGVNLLDLVEHSP